MSVTEDPSQRRESVLGRSLDDVEYITDLARANLDADSLAHEVTNNADTMFTWDYTKGARPRLERLYEKAKTSQWNGSTDLDWSIDVDPEGILPVMSDIPPTPEDLGINDPNSPIYKWDDKQLRAFNTEQVRWRLSNFLHGEQGALLCTAKIVETVPWIDAKYYAATQVVDEARHVEVFGQVHRREARRSVPDQRAPRLAARRHHRGQPLGHDLSRHADHGRGSGVGGVRIHAHGHRGAPAQGAAALRDERRGAPTSRSACSASRSTTSTSRPPSCSSVRSSASRRRSACGTGSWQQEVWEAFGVDTKEMCKRILEVPPERAQEFQRMLFSKIVPNCKKLGLLDAGDGWLRDRFTEIGVIQFENWEDTSEEYLELDAVEADREGRSLEADEKLAEAAAAAHDH